MFRQREIPPLLLILNMFRLVYYVNIHRKSEVRAAVVGDVNYI